MADVTHIAIAVVENRNGDFLVGRRPQGVALAGYAEFPGGKVELGESPREAAMRECREETGLELATVNAFSEVRHEYDHGVLQLYFFHCRPLGDDTRVAGFQWVERAKLATLKFPAANQGVIEQLLEQC